ncbi:hypothetical protein LSH36_499g01038 [Paralvinella palmiformis]|uniref:Uncharacterized protein n=1 Tax=Paralvinella palmiformis TaxID=53620 RepID=A0AAD9J946_9ANNE|nr:hypothetical protein LSH36_499g01038 [Paralvinella palmiformis]
MKKNRLPIRHAGRKLNGASTDRAMRCAASLQIVCSNPVRAKLDSGHRIVGIRYPEILIPLVEKQIQEDDMIRNMMAREQAQMIKRSMFSGEDLCLGSPDPQIPSYRPEWARLARTPSCLRHSWPIDVIKLRRDVGRWRCED